MKDCYNREIDYMRISVTNRCNFRCSYCMPEIRRQEEPLSLKEIYQVALAAVKCGISKFKITGGEPLVRDGIVEFVRRLSEIAGDITMTSNGFYLQKYAGKLKSAGLSSVNVSLDSLNKERFRSITGTDALDEVLAGIREAVNAGLHTKINTVLQKGINEDEILDIIGLAERCDIDIRFIEMMPIGHGRLSEGISNVDVLEIIKSRYGAVKKEEGRLGNGPASYVRIDGFEGAIGFIGAIHGKFCDSCNRIRFTSTGKLKPCLSYDTSIDLAEVLKSTQLSPEEKQAELAGLIRSCILCKPYAHAFEDLSKVSEKRDMVEIGG